METWRLRYLEENRKVHQALELAATQVLQNKHFYWVSYCEVKMFDFNHARISVSIGCWRVPRPCIVLFMLLLTRELCRDREHAWNF